MSGDNPKDVHISRMVVGAIWAALGIGVTAWSYVAASSGGSKYVVAWGAIAWGLFSIGRGVAGLFGTGADDSGSAESQPEPDEADPESDVF